METVAISVQRAEEFLKAHGRHYVQPVEKIAAIAVGDPKPGAADGCPIEDAYVLHGAAILGRRENGDAELAHIYVDGVSQGYSLLYGACWRALKALGYKRAWL